MIETTDFLVNIRAVFKLHENMLKRVCAQYGLSLIEANVISFLYNNPGKDTAADIVELRMLSKGNVSAAVEELIQKSLIIRKPDKVDRRKIHLELLPGSKPITDAIEESREQFFKEVYAGLSKKECEQFEQLNSRVMKNAAEAMRRNLNE